MCSNVTESRFIRDAKPRAPAPTAIDPNSAGGGPNRSKQGRAAGGLCSAELALTWGADQQRATCARYGPGASSFPTATSSSASICSEGDQLRCQWRLERRKRHDRAPAAMEATTEMTPAAESLAWPPLVLRPGLVGFIVGGA